ncbi:MAG: hypothetical protein FD187_2694 [bacterium]|nr:MAG: hypothetical protein FD142_190 [bacterium]KAF0147531.1 MAG: hypothetical protein FD187_2694 [bacterium]KAF0166018.1 MAG: hypothetical protein FD158_2769 [bacterium]TXT16611.1 MAG: hypothetical protein FD132_2771 [bacterium]
MKGWLRSSPIWLLAVLLLPAGRADTLDPLSEAEFFADQPLVLSASRLATPANRAPAAVSVITREMIEATGFRHLVDVLRLVPGFIVGWSGGNTAAATYLGLSEQFPHRMQIMVDGRSVYDPSFGHTVWRGIPVALDEVERIEVVRGPNAAHDGLNAMMGTIHVYTRHSSATLGGMGEVAIGNRDYRETNLRYGGMTDNGSWRLGFLAREDEIHGVDQDRANDVQVNFRGDFSASPWDDVMLEFGLSRGRWQGTNIGNLFYDDQHAQYVNGYANLLWKHVLPEGREWALQFNHTYSQNQEAIPLPAPIDPLSGDYRTSGTALELSYLDRSSAELKKSLSGEFRLNRVRLPMQLDNDYDSDYVFSLSGALEWNPAAEWVVHLGTMLERHSDNGDTSLSPRFVVNWLPSDAHAFRLGIAHGETATSIYVNNVDIRLSVGGVTVDQIFASTEDLEPEKINTVELGYHFSKPEWGLNLDTRIFHNRLYDVVDVDSRRLPNNDRYNVYFNHPTIEVWGLEYQLKWRFARKGWLWLSQAWLSSHSSDDIMYERSVPGYTLSLLASHPLGGLDASVGYYYTEPMRWYAGKYDSKYNRLDARLAKNWKTASGKWQAALVLQSLNGVEDESFSEYLYKHQKYQRRGYVSLKYEFY